MFKFFKSQTSSWIVEKRPVESENPWSGILICQNRKAYTVKANLTVCFEQPTQNILPEKAGI